MSDLGSHWIDLAWWALKLNYPLTIEADGLKQVNKPQTLRIKGCTKATCYEYL